MTAAWLLALLAAPAAAHVALLSPGPVDRESTGTSWQPAAAGMMDGLHVMRGPWMVMAHGEVTGAFTTSGGERGKDAAFTTSMLMASAARPWARGAFGARAMLSLDALNGPRGYPLLLQTGETADGRRPLIDRQHPHDLLMELAVLGHVETGPDASAFLYAGYPGEPPLGPPAFMHRPSNGGNPEAPIGHHWIDSTHYVYGAATAGLVRGPVKAEAGTFTGREPDRRRWGADRPRFDSSSFRLSWNPSPAWALQASLGRIHSPHQLVPAGDTDRFTVSAAHSRAHASGRLDALAAWGRNKDAPGNTSDAVLLEGAWKRRGTTLFLRGERVEKGELVQVLPAGHPLVVRTYGSAPYEPLHVPGQPAGSPHEPLFAVGRVTLGGVRDFATAGRASFGLGASVSLHVLPSDLDAAYGADPWSGLVWIRAQLH